MVNKEVLDFLRKGKEVLARLNIARERMRAFIPGSTTFDMVSLRVHSISHICRCSISIFLATYIC